MKLFYFRDPAGNFGDDLNPWIWPKIAPGVLTEHDDALLVGIGTLLNHRLPLLPTKHVVGSGVGYGDLPKIDSRFVFHAVRGFETARMLNLSAETVITDSAVLVRRIPNLPPPATRTRVAIMLTGESLANYQWLEVCNRAGIDLISCHWDVDRVISAILGCDMLLAEAMHGAIVADALRKPWIPVTCNDSILAFKWQDWLSSLGLAYEPTIINPLYDVDRDLSSGKKIRNHVKRRMAAAGLWRSNWGQLPRHRSTQREVDLSTRELIASAKRKPILSDERLLRSHERRYIDCIDRLMQTQ